MTPHAPQNNGWMDPDPKGMWFHADEVEALEAGFAKLEAENAAANATLDRLREVFMRLCKGNEMSEAIDDMDAILYQTPENDNGMD